MKTYISQPHYLSNDLPTKVTFELTKKQFQVWKRHYFAAGLDNIIGFNESYNQSIGLPCQQARNWLSKLASDSFGWNAKTSQHLLTWSMVQKQLA